MSGLQIKVAGEVQVSAGLMRGGAGVDGRRGGGVGWAGDQGQAGEMRLTRGFQEECS